jgi:DNA anti-recombination protein RmuC
VSEMKEILYRLTEMGQDIKDIKTDVGELKTDVADIKTDVSELKTRMGNLESSVEQIKTRQEVIFEQTGGLLEFRTETKAILLDIQESQLATSDILGEHEISIRGLRRRLV